MSDPLDGLWRPAKRTARRGGKAAGDHPGLALLLFAAVLWLAGQYVLAVGLAVLVIAGPALAVLLADAWWRVRLTVRLGITAVAALAATVALAAPLLLIPAGIAGTTGGTVALYRWLRLRPHRKEYVEPLHWRLAPRLNLDPEIVRPRAWLDVPVDLFDAEGGTVVTLPFGYYPKPAEKADITEIVATTLGKSPSAIRADWRMRGQDRFVRFTSKATTPLEVLYADQVIRGMYENAKESRPLLALGPGDKPIAVDYDAESPHMLLAAGTGGGKSVLLRLLIAKALHHGAYVVICDMRRTSQRWAKGLPGVLYARTAEEIHRALLEVRFETERREEIAENMPPDSEPTWPRIVLACDEWAITQPELVEFWREIREPSDGPTSPAMRAFRRTLMAGRASKVNALVVVQRGDAKELGGGNARAQFATRIAARADKPAWKLIMDDAPYVPPSKRRGRVHIKVHGDMYEGQVVFMSEEEAIEYACSGRESPKSLVAASRIALPPGETVRDGRELVADSTPELTKLRDALEATGAPTIPDDVELVTLPEASIDKGRDLLGGSTYDSLRAASRRDPEFPDPMPFKRGNAWVFRLDELQRWKPNRERGTTAGGTT